MNQLTFSRALLIEALTMAASFVKPRAPHPVMAGILFSFDANGLTLTGMSDVSGISIQYEEPMDCPKDISFVVPHKLMTTALNRMNTDEVSMSLDDLDSFQVKLQGGKNHVVLEVLNSMDYPALPKGEEDSTNVQVESHKFSHALRYLVPFASDDQTRLVLNGVYFDHDYCYSTDGHRMVQLLSNVVDGQLVLPIDSLRQIDKCLLKEFPLEITFGEYGSIALFKNGPLTFFSRVLEGQYPNCAQLIPGSFKFTATLDRQELLSQLEFVMTVASEKNNVVALHPKDGFFSITAEASGVGAIEGYANATIKGTIDSFGMNGNYLMEPLRLSKAKTVTIKGNSKTSPFVLTIEGEDGFTYLLMPVQIRN